MEPAPRRKLGSYVLEEKLGSGATADVYKAMQSGIERSVAIKVMHPHLAGSADFSARFQREAQAMGQLQHPHISRVIDFDPAGDHPFMVMEHLAGGSLRELIDSSSTRLPTDYAISITRQLADALQYAHSMGMVHRDLKPANVMFVDGEARHAVLTDFGMARLTDQAMTVSGTMLGTPAYMAPEQVRGEGAGPAADQYSLGVMLFELATGELPYNADSIHGVMMKHTDEPIPSARSINPQLSVELDALIYRTLAKEPADRFASIADMQAELDLLGSGIGASMKPATIVAPAAKPSPRANATSAPSKAKLGLAVAGVAAIAGLTVFGLTRGGGEEAIVTQPEVPTLEVVETPDVGDQDNSPDPATSPEPAAQPTTAAASDPIPTPIDLNDLPAFFITGARINDDRFLVHFEALANPPSNTAYVAWLDNVEGPIGELVFDEDGGARLDALAPTAALATQFTMSAEPTGTEPTAPTGPVLFRATIAPDLRAVYTSMLLELDAAEAEMVIAFDHDQFLRDEVAADDIGEVRRHAEHVVNILAAKGGPNFGDHDGDGLAQNPGNDIGIRAKDTIKLFAESEEAARQGSVDELLVMRADDLAAQFEPTQAPYLRITAADSTAEVNVDGGLVELQNLDRNLQLLRSAIEREVALHLAFANPAEGARAIDLSHLSPDGTEAIVQVGALTVLDDGERVVLLGDGGTSAGVTLDKFGMARLPLPQDLQTEPVRITIADTTGSVLASGQLSVDNAKLLDEVRALSNSLGEQIQIAIDHAELMQQEIELNNHGEVRRHAEHVVNILEGAGGEHFGDLDGDGLAQNPGDDIGVLSYLESLKAPVSALSSRRVTSEEIWHRTIEAARAQALTGVDEALRVLASDSAVEAGPKTDLIFDAMVKLRDGSDINGDGLVSLYNGELGAGDFNQQALMLTRIRLDPSN